MRWMIDCVKIRNEKRKLSSCYRYVSEDFCLRIKEKQPLKVHYVTFFPGFLIENKQPHVNLCICKL